MEEIWNYGINYNDGRVYIAIWGSGVLEFDVATQKWKEYLDPDGEMEIDLHRDDGLVHVITTGVSYVDKVLWVTTYFGVSRYDGRRWRGFFSKEGGLPNEFNNNVKARSGNEAWFCTDKGLGVIADVASNTWVQYTAGPKPPAGKAVVKRGTDALETVELAAEFPTLSSSAPTSTARTPGWGRPRASAGRSATARPPRAALPVSVSFSPP